MDRTIILRRASTHFGMQWAELDTPQAETWEDRGYILNRVDAFWLNAHRKGLSVQEACEDWADFAIRETDLSTEIRLIGDILMHTARERDLTHSEINTILAGARNSDSHHQLKAEREQIEGNDPEGP